MHHINFPSCGILKNFADVLRFKNCNLTVEGNDLIFVPYNLNKSCRKLNFILTSVKFYGKLKIKVLISMTKPWGRPSFIEHAHA
jgi:hypothetical protein